ncbi:MAG: GNAT family N-acetyltransferase [Ferruginibacter sp.]
MAFTLNILPLAGDDIEELVNLVNSAYRGESSKKGWTTEANLLDGLRTDQKSIQALMEKPGAIILSATNESRRIVGCVYLQPKGQQLYLGMLTVAPDLQAKGIGKQLLLAAETWGRKINCSSILMSVIDIRHELIDWYQRKGYQSTGEKKPFPPDNAFGIPKQPLQFIMLEKKI